MAGIADGDMDEDRQVINITQEQDILEAGIDENINLTLFSTSTPFLSSPPPVSSPATSNDFPLAEVLSAILVSYLIVIILVF